MGLLPAFKEFYVSYGSYHYNIVNKIIHIICIPQIYFTLLCLVKHLNAPVIPILPPYLNIEFALAIVGLTNLAYLNVDLVSGLISSIFYSGFYIANNLLFKYATDHKLLDEHLKYAAIIHCVAWIFQFIGHGVFEKRKPALLDNLLLTFVAPDFVIIEILFFFGYKRNIRESADKAIEENIRLYRKSKEKAQ